jgi:hypothetical protein
MTNERARADFEKWVSDESSMKSWSNPDATAKRRDSEYFYAHAEIAWRAWQAGRASLQGGAASSSVPESAGRMLGAAAKDASEASEQDRQNLSAGEARKP